jgi:hypothetical protein
MDIVGLHKHLAYLLFLASMVNLAMAMSAGRAKSIASVLKWTHAVGVLHLGRLTIVLGLAAVHLAGWPLTTWWLWVSLLLWGPVEAVGKKLVKADLAVIAAGGQATRGLVKGTAIQLICILVIFGLMSARP